MSHTLDGYTRKLRIQISNTEPMQIIKLNLAIAIILMVVGCGSTLYSKKEFRTQTTPVALKNKTWTLVEIHSEKILDKSLTTEFNNTSGTANCKFTFQFDDNGQLLMSFKEYKFKGTYLIDGDRFKFVYNGFREKIVWTTNPECKITPTELGYILNWREFEFTIQGNKLTMKNKTGDVLSLTTTIQGSSS